MLKNFILLFLLLASFVNAQNIDSVLIKAENELNVVRQKNDKLIQDISSKRKNLETGLQSLRSKIKILRNEYSNLTEENYKLYQSKLELEQQVSEKTYEVTDFKNSIKEIAKDFYTELQISSTSNQYKEDFNVVRNLVKSNRYPDKKYLNTVLTNLLKEVRRGSEVISYKGKYFNPEGKEEEGTIIRFGKIMSVFKNQDKKIGFLSYAVASGYLYEVPMKLSWLMKSNLDNYFENPSNALTNIVPIDITGGTAFEQLKIKKSFLGHIQAGGIIVYPILALGIIALIIVVERIIILNQLHTKSDKLMPELVNKISEGKWDEAEEVCNSLPGSVSRVCIAGLKHKDMDKMVLEDVLQESILKELPALERFLSVLKVFAAIAPLLGLLGTVTGMISTFDVITIFGTGDPRLMSGGISEALVTTEIGLIVAVPILLLHSFLAARVNHIVNEMEKNAVTLANMLSLRGAEK